MNICAGLSSEMTEDRAPYQKPVPQPCPVCGQAFTPSGLWRGEVCPRCTTDVVETLTNSVVIGRFGERGCHD